MCKRAILYTKLTSLVNFKITLHLARIHRWHTTFPNTTNELAIHAKHSSNTLVTRTFSYIPCYLTQIYITTLCCFSYVHLIADELLQRMIKRLLFFQVYHSCISRLSFVLFFIFRQLCFAIIYILIFSLFNMLILFKLNDLMLLCFYHAGEYIRAFPRILSRYFSWDIQFSYIFMQISVQRHTSLISLTYCIFAFL